MTAAAKKRKEFKEKKIMREKQELQDKIIRGTKGKGEKDNYKYWCRKCEVEYTCESPKCFHCGKATLTREERKKELEEMVDVYKKKKDKRNERKHKWEMWKKTKNIFWKKTATDYSKWEYFTESEDDMEEAEKNAKPIVPENDPQFKALELDMEQRKAKSKKDKKAADE